jgi:hypothetical protein
MLNQYSFFDAIARETGEVSVSPLGEDVKVSPALRITEMPRLLHTRRMKVACAPGLGQS